VFDVLVEPALQESTGCFRLANGTGYVPSSDPNYFLEQVDIDGTTISVSPTGGFSALHHASRAGRFDLVSMLVCASNRGSLSTQGASLCSLRDARRRTALQLAVETLAEIESSAGTSSRREDHPELFVVGVKSSESRVGGAQIRGLDSESGRGDDDNHEEYRSSSNSNRLVIGLKKVIDFLAGKFGVTQSF